MKVTVSFRKFLLNTFTIGLSVSCVRSFYAYCVLTMSNPFYEDEVDEIAISLRYEKCPVHSRNVWRMATYMSEDGIVKVHVYLRTRTVVTQLDHPRKGKTQLFRRDISKEELVRILQDPREHTSKGYYKRSTSKNSYNAIHNIERLKCRFDISDTRKFVEEKLKGELSDKTSIESVCLGYDSVFILYTDGRSDHFNIPQILRNRIEEKRDVDIRPEIVALGTHHPDSYFVQFQDGQQSWRHVPQELDRVLNDYIHSQSPYYVDAIGFGGSSSRGYFFVRFTDGKVYYDLPANLKDRLYDNDVDDRDIYSRIVRISFGKYNSSGSYSVECSSRHHLHFMDSYTYDKDLQDLTDARDYNSIQHVAMGAKGDYLILTLA